MQKHGRARVKLPSVKCRHPGASAEAETEGGTFSSASCGLRTRAMLQTRQSMLRDAARANALLGVDKLQGWCRRLLSESHLHFSFCKELPC